MPRKPRAASCIVTSLSTNLAGQYKGLWITDALLAETFRSFCHSPRRYGSNVPGPLEARRRASKRKNTSLAYTGGGEQLVYDPAVMLGSGLKDQWWKEVDEKPASARSRSGKERVKATASSLLPEWLFGSTFAPTLSDSSYQQTHLDQELPETEDALRIEDLEAVFTNRIRRTTTFKMVEIVVQNMNVSLRQHPKLSQIAFRHLVDVAQRTRNYDKLEQALHDPLLHPPGSGNHLFLLRHLCSNRLSRKSWEASVLPSILKAIELGLISTNDLQEIIFIIPDIHQAISTQHPSSKTHAEWHRILTAIEQSRVLQLEDFDRNMLSTWFQRVANTAQADASCFLMWRLRKFSGRSELKLASELTIGRLKDSVETEASTSEKLIGWLSSLPVDIRGPAIIQATFSMTSAAQNNEYLAQQVLEKWSTMLPQLGSEEMLELPINKTTWSEASVVSCSLTPPQQLLSVIWIVTRLWASRPNETSHFANMNLQDEFKSIFTNMADVEQFDHVSRVVLTLDTLPLPQKEQIFPFLQHFTVESLIKMLGHEEYLDGLRACVKLEYAQLKNNTFAWTARYKYPQIMNTLAQSINTDLAQFQAMAQTLILKSSENFRIVKRLLDYNMELKFALSQSWPSVLLEHKIQGTQADIGPGAILAMLEKLIMTFAVTPVITPRSSFRHVYKMYLFLHKCGAPINPVVARALWHAGVTRYGQLGAPKAQVMWCFSKVREIEGEKAAERLLWSAGFRRSFVKEFADQFKRSPRLTELPTSLKRDNAESDVDDKKMHIRTVSGERVPRKGVMRKVH